MEDNQLLDERLKTRQKRIREGSTCVEYEDGWLEGFEQGYNQAFKDMEQNSVRSDRRTKS